MYAFVDVVDYQKVVATDSSKGIEKAAEAYLGEIIEEGTGQIEKEITIKTITNAIIDGNTYYYIEDEENKKYKVSIKADKNNLPFLQIGDKVIIKYNKEADITTIKEIELIK